MFSRTVSSFCFKNNAKVYGSVFLPYFRKYSNEINVVKSKIPDILLPNALVHEYVWENVDKWHDKTALVRINYTYEYNVIIKNN